MTAHLMTRGTARRLDYRFLGSAPASYWWRAAADWTDLEGPALVVRNTRADELHVLISGLRSARRDVVGTVVRYTLVLDDPDYDVLVWLVAAAIDPAGRAGIAAALDAEFPSARVDEVLAGGADDPAPDVAQRLDRALAAARDRTGPGRGPEDDDEPVLPRSWAWGGPGADRALMARAGQLGSGELAGWAFTTTILSSVEGASRAAAALGDPVAIHMDLDGPADPVDLAARPAGRGKAPAGRGAGPSRPSRRPSVPVALALVLTGTVVAAVFLLFDLWPL